MHSSPSFGSRRRCSHSNLSPADHGRPMVHFTKKMRRSHLSLSLRIRVCHPNTRIYVRLLGPCFKTGRMKPFARQLPRYVYRTPARSLPWSLHSLRAVNRRPDRPPTGPKPESTYRGSSITDDLGRRAITLTEASYLPIRPCRSSVIQVGTHPE